jgi:uncharacterized protein (TIGR02453 family)
MFQGFSDRTFAFFDAIAFNNTKEFFHSNHKWYEEAVRTPLRELTIALTPAIEQLDDTLDCRVEKVVSRINRDIRFSHDKSLYRSYMWLAFRRSGEERKTTLGAYFDISSEGASYGIGIYSEHRPFMNGLRHRLLTDEESFLQAYLPVKDEFELCGNRFKRMPIPETLSAAAKAWYPMRGFWLEKDLTDFDLLCSADLVEEIKGGFMRLIPIYRYLQTVPEMD